MSMAMDIARRRAAQGFGAWSDFEMPQIEVPPGWEPGQSTSGGNDDDDDGPPWWVTSVPLFSVIGKTASNIFAPYQASVAQAGAGYYRPTQTLTYEQQLALAARNREGVGLGVDSSGIRLSDGSRIGWFPIIGVIGFFYVLQARPLTRK